MSLNKQYLYQFEGKLYLVCKSCSQLPICSRNGLVYVIYRSKKVPFGFSCLSSNFSSSLARLLRCREVKGVAGIQVFFFPALLQQLIFRFHSGNKEVPLIYSYQILRGLVVFRFFLFLLFFKGVYGMCKYCWKGHNMRILNDAVELKVRNTCHAINYRSKLSKSIYKLN